jgi:RNA polymerase sigma-70 factor, ECF subfamily
MDDGALTTFASERTRLLGLAYRMLGSHADADDVLQEAWLRWQRLSDSERADIARPGAWLRTVVTRLAIDQLRRSQRRRETYVGPWLPEPLVTDRDSSFGREHPEQSLEMAESLTLGFLAVLERLEPVERAVFLLADVFGESFADIAVAVDRSPTACRQIAVRARHRVRGERRASTRPSAERRDTLVASFLAACADGNLDRLKATLVDDVTVVSDAGGARRAARHPVIGADRASRFLVHVWKQVPPGVTAELHEVNGESGMVLFRDGLVWGVVAIEVCERGVTAVRLMLNPDKLALRGPFSAGNCAPRWRPGPTPG